ncbi:MAG: SDR family NAD(P)-dependent oxidoreductase [Actinomycetota bacterium]
MTDEAAVGRLAEQAIDRFGRVNVLCNNAGVAGSQLFAGVGHVEVNDWRWVIDVNLFGVIHGHAAFLPHLLEHGDGHIVNTSSMAGHFVGHSAYTASKWAVVGMTEGLYAQLKRTGSTVGVSCLCPGWVNTRIADSDRNRPEWAAPGPLDDPDPMAEAGFAFAREQLAAGMPPEDLADLVHDAIVEDHFWIFTDPTMVQALKGRYDAILGNENPPVPEQFGQ